MTEREAWLAMARAWARAREDRFGVYRVGGGAGALCGTVLLLERTKLIPGSVADRMYKTLARAASYRKVGWCSYIWPRDAAGAKARAAFCLKIAARRGRGR